MHTDLRPYWLGSAAVANTFTLQGIFLLTAPNMSGKSTLMRSTMAAALLAGAGLHVPAAAATVPRYDAFFLRTASFDVPAEGKVRACLRANLSSS
jgi:DNA mismatch repair ATPase MutS